MSDNSDCRDSIMHQHPNVCTNEASSSCVDTCRCCSIIDPRERHIVCKLERYELEDRYLRLLEEIRALKKVSNGQEDKIKRLATKLMRFGASPKNCLDLAIAADDQNRISLLEVENAKLKDKICVLKSQLVNNKLFERSSSRGRRINNGSTVSGPTTYRSESSRLKASSCHYINARPENDERDVQNYRLKIQQMEKEKKTMMSHITDLELELASYTSGNRREKVAENVEYIRLWRQMKRQNEKLVATETANEILNGQIYQLKSQLDDSYKNNQKVNSELAVERQRAAQLETSLSNYQGQQVELRERNERITDLSNELTILQEHNNELLQLSAKFSKVEQENVELKRKLGEEVTEEQLLRGNLAKEKASVAALQAANEQLLTKLHELQKNIDVMSIQLMALKEKQECKDQMPSLKESSSSLERITDLREKAVQTNNTLRLVSESTQTDKPLVSAKSKESVSVDKYDVCTKIQLSRNGSSLSREGMLKLLEQVQISTPLESQNASRLRSHQDSSSTIPLRVSKQVSNLESMLFGDLGF